MKLVIFDLDGVIVSTDRFHYLAWKSMADARGYAFDETTNHLLRGVSRAESLQIILDKNNTSVEDTEFQAMLAEKNTLYRESLQKLSPEDILPGVSDLLKELRSREMLTAIGSSSRNTPLILEKIGMTDGFDTIVDGNMISRSKPDPQVFLKGAEALSIDPSDCLVFEDAQAGVDAAVAAEMKVVGLGDEPLKNCDLMRPSLEQLRYEELEALFALRD